MTAIFSDDKEKAINGNRIDVTLSIQYEANRLPTVNSDEVDGRLQEPPRGKLTVFPRYVIQNRRCWFIVEKPQPVILLLQIHMRYRNDTVMDAVAIAMYTP